MTQCKRCLFDSSFAFIHQDGECEYCKLHDQLEKNSNPADLMPAINRVKKSKGKSCIRCTQNFIVFTLCIAYLFNLLTESPPDCLTVS